MNSIQISNQIYRIIRLTFKHLTEPQKNNLSDVTTALFYHNNFTLYDIASKIPSEIDTKHKLKRLIYFLDTLKIDKEYWKSHVKTLFSLPYMRIQRRQYITLLIDFTTLRDDYLILAGCISYMGRSIPVYMKIWEGVNEPYDYWGRVKGFIKELKELMPIGKEYEIIADRGFQGTKLFEICKEIGWDYVYRINDNYKIKLGNGQEYIQMSLFEDGFYEDVLIGQVNPMKGNLAVNSVMGEDRQRKKWCLVSSIRDRDRVIDSYKSRMWIEETFRDLKGVLKWEKYTKKLPVNGRLQKLIIISCLSYAIMLSLGSSIEVPPSEEEKRTIVKRFNAIVSSAHRRLREIVMRVVALFRVNYYRCCHLSHYFD